MKKRFFFEIVQLSHYVQEAINYFAHKETCVAEISLYERAN